MGNLIKPEIFENYMKEHNLSKTAFCKLCKISPSVFNKIIGNQRNFYVIALFRIARVIGIEVYQMFEN